MSLSSGELSPADIRACTCGNDSGGYGNEGNLWGGGGALLCIIILFLFGLFGWGGNGFGGFGGGNGVNGAASQGALTRGELCMDMNFQELKNTAARAATAVDNGFANLNSTICSQQYETTGLINNLGSNIQNSLNAMNISNLQTANSQNIANLQSTNAIQAQLAQCCCENREGQAQINYNLATQSCETRNTIQNSTRDIIDNQNANARAILDKMCQQELAAKDAQIAAQNQQIFGLQLAASREKQNNYIVNALRPFTGTGCCGYNNYNNYNCSGCGCSA